jgi:hypothetical protein
MTPSPPAPFYIKDCALATISTGEKAQLLTEFRDKLATIPPASIYLHFWGRRLRTAFEHHEYHNDFSFWAHHALNDDFLAERLELLDPTEYADLEVLRAAMIDIIERHLDEQETIPMAKREQQFYFLLSRIVVFNTRYQIKTPEELAPMIPLMSRSSIFYHCIDAARRTPFAENDFSNWLRGFGDQYQELIDQLHNLDPYFISLADLQKKLELITYRYFSGKSI